MPPVFQSASRSLRYAVSRREKVAHSRSKLRKDPRESKLIFVLGGARSGKSTFALQPEKAGIFGYG